MKSIQLKIIVITVTLATIFSPTNTIAKQKQHKQYGKNAPFLINELPNGNIKTKLKKLSRKKQEKAMNWLHSMDFSEHDLSHMKIDNEGAVLYGDTFDFSELTESTDQTAESPQTISAIDTFKLHSKPGASNTIYIDVNGHTITGTAWNDSSTNIHAKPFDTNGNTTVFSNTELSQIAEIWHRIAEDFAPFDTDVTTEEPNSFGSNTGRILITHNKDTSGNNMPYSTSGGVAYVNVWGRSNYASYYSPALVYYNNLSSYAPYIAEAASHEMGHNLGLSHDGTSIDSYYSGHGSGFVSWGAIMGVGYYTNVTQWSKGEYTDASLTTQDDINIIISQLNLRADDHGNDIYTPSPLLVDPQGNVSVTSPEIDPMNLSPENKGIIETRNDVDFFAFDAGTGSLTLTISPAWDSFYRSSRRGANLDIQATLYNWDGQVITNSDPIDETDAQINVNVTAGQYLLAITGTGNSASPYSDYGSLGQYFISGNITPYTPITDTTAPTPNPMGWSVLPYSQSRSSISMQATTAIDDSGTVQYKFICLTGAECSDSTWQSSTQYTATNLQSGSNYSFQVLAQDQFGNETSPSVTASASTYANNAPQTENSIITTQEDNAVNINLAAQTTDADSDPLSFSIQSQPSYGSVTNQNDGTIRYIPDNNYFGTDSFSYLVSDDFGGTDTAIVSINITSVNDKPVISTSASINNNSLSVNFYSTGSFDPDNSDTLIYQWSFGDGNSSNAANPSYAYVVAGTYNVILTITDNHGLSNTKTISITVIDSSNLLPETPNNLTYSSNKTVSGRGKNKIISGTVTLNWNTADFANTYNIYRCDLITSGKRKNRTTTCNYSLFSSTINSSFQTSLTNSSVRYKVNAVNTNGSSDFSNEVTIKQ